MYMYMYMYRYIYIYHVYTCLFITLNTSDVPMGSAICMEGCKRSAAGWKAGGEQQQNIYVIQ